ncbi:hypothetical protein Cma02nite_31840 [Cellulomonas marina]|nr:hypothetical protein Cma02nite_31840 [Cellulomonas marina]
MPSIDDAALAACVAAMRSAVLVADARDADLPLVFVNDGFEQLTGYARASALGRNCRFLQGPGTDQAVVGALRVGLAEGRYTRARLLNYRADGSTFWNDLRLSPVHHDDGTLRYWVGVQHDVTAQVAQETALARAATQDPLTGLANRTVLAEHLRGEVARASAAGRAVAVLFLDLDDDKQVNDSRGHLAGDQLLVEIGRRMRAVLRPGDLVARFGGDELVVVVGDLPLESGGRVRELVEGLRQAVERPVPLPDGDVRVGVSIGVAVHPHDAADGDTLLAVADAAMFRDKRSR